MNWDISGLIIEGICCTGKTTLIQALTRSPRYNQKSYPSSVVISEHHTQRVLERKQALEGLVPDDHLALLEFYVQFFEKIYERSSQMDWNARNRTNHQLPFLLERFHFTHVFHYGLEWELVRSIDERLAKINSKVCVLEINEADMERRIILERNEGWRKYLQNFGRTNSEIVDYYQKQQALLLSLLQKTKLQWLKINTSETTVEDTVSQVLNFWDI
ncbi:MAG TPA: hypothetical protein PLA25_01120 [Anaerolineaceae bacterium]|nr:hypothetical protein [Anaerolineaceae bacterium]